MITATPKTGARSRKACTPQAQQPPSVGGEDGGENGRTVKNISINQRLQSNPAWLMNPNHTCRPFPAVRETPAKSELMQ
jgi:hypothetical protein